MISELSLYNFFLNYNDSIDSNIYISINTFVDDHGDDESMTVLAELEKIDDDCDRHGIQFVKIDDVKAAKDFGIDDVPSIVYFEKQIPNVYDGNYLQKIFYI